MWRSFFFSILLKAIQFFYTVHIEAFYVAAIFAFIYLSYFKRSSFHYIFPHYFIPFISFCKIGSSHFEKYEEASINGKRPYFNKLIKADFNELIKILLQECQEENS